MSIERRRRVLIAGVGNVFLSDDGFGVEVVSRLTREGVGLPPEAEVADIGIRGVHLAYQLLDGYSALILVDVVNRGGEPGTLYVLEHDLNDNPEPAGDLTLDGHDMSPDAVLALLDELAVGVGVGRPVDRVLVVGCQPAVLQEGMGLSDPVAAAVPEAVRVVRELVDDLTSGKGEEDVGTLGVRSASGRRGSGGGAVTAGHGALPGTPGHVTGAPR